MRGRGYSTHSMCLSVCLCVCVSATALAGATRTLRAQLRYQKKALDTRIKINVGIELKVLSSKVMTVCSSPRKLQWVLLAETRHHQATNAFGGSSAASSTTNYRLLSFTNLAGLAITYFDPKTARGSVVGGVLGRGFDIWARFAL